jgi:hypothetical protein
MVQSDPVATIIDSSTIHANHNMYNNDVTPSGTESQEDSNEYILAQPPNPHGMINHHHLLLDNQSTIS